MGEYLDPLQCWRGGRDLSLSRICKREALRNCLHKYVKQGTSQRDRGLKAANFHVLRESKMVATLGEYGFMD